MILDFRLLQTHIFAVIRDEGGSIMNVCERIELCVMNECVAVFEGRWFDTHFWVKGNGFYVFRGFKRIQMGGLQINFTKQEILPERIDRFDLSSYDFCELAKTLGRESGQLGNWNCLSINKEFDCWLDEHKVLDPHVLSFIHSSEGEHRVYSKS